MLRLMSRSRHAVLVVSLAVALFAAACSSDAADAPVEPDDAEQLPSVVDAVVPAESPPSEARIETLLATPDPVAPIREHTVSLFEGAYEWVFANGTRVVFAPSDLESNYVDMTAQSLGG